MLAALIASQSLVALVSAAPTPTEDFVVNYLQLDFIEKHKANQAFLKGKCLMAKDPKNDCTDALPVKEVEDALDFLGKHNSCKALTTQLKMKFVWGGEEYDNFPMEAYCYVRAKECGKLTKANFPNYKEITLAKSRCSGSSKPSEIEFARSGTLIDRLFEMRRQALRTF